MPVSGPAQSVLAQGAATGRVDARGGEMDAVSGLQEEEYSFPYHYMPTIANGQVRLYPYWSWGYRYLGGIEVVLSRLRRLEFSSLLDLGCGDGRLLNELSLAFPNVRLAGFDYSERAVALARAMNPALDFQVRDVAQDPSEEDFDVVTLIEVLEHIHPDECARFLRGIRRWMSPGSKLVLTVPHINEPLNCKHYRHFSSKSLLDQISPHFELETLFFFDRKSTRLSLWQRLMCNRFFIVRHQGVTNRFFRFYREACLEAEEGSCLRLGGIFSPRAS